MSQIKPAQENSATSANAAKAEKPGSKWLVPGAVLFYLALTVALTWPLVLNFGSSVPNGPPEDRFQNFWNFWWVGRALAHFKNPYQTDVLFYPYFSGGATPTIPLYLHTLQLLSCLLLLPITLTSGVAAAYNSLIFLTFTLSGLGAFLLARHLTGSLWAGLLGGIIYTFSISHFGSVTSSITNIMSIQWLPFYVLALQLWHERRNLKWAALAAIFLTLTVYTDWYITLFLLFYTGFFYLVTGWPRSWLKQLPGVAVALLGAGLLGAPAIIPAFFTLRNPIFAAQFDVNRDIRSSNTLLSLVSLATVDGWLFWIGLLVGAGLILTGGRWRRIGGYWLAFYLVCSIFTLGPRLQIDRVGDPTPTDIPLPYALIKLVPGASVMRSPDRFDIPAQLALAMLLAVALERIQRKVQSSEWARNSQPLENSHSPMRWLRQALPAGLVFLVVALPYLWLVNPVPLTLVAVGPSNFVKSLPKEGNFGLLELPLTRHYNFDHERMLNQIYHQQPIMGGYLARPVSDPYREPDSPFRYLAEQAYVYAGDPNKEIFAARHTFALVDNLIKLYNFKYVVLYKDDYKFERERKGNRELIERQTGPDALLQEDEHTLLYKVPESFWQTPVAMPGLFVGKGWYGVEQNADGFYRWTEREADLNVTVDRLRHLKIALTVQAFGGDRSIAISANGQKLYEGRITPAPATLQIEFEAKAGTNQLHIESLTPAQTAKESGLGQDTRPLAFLVRRITVGE